MPHTQPISVDDRDGSRQLGAVLAKRKFPVSMGRLEFGDASFMGAGPEGRPIPIGIEYKSVGDVVSCISDGRFAGHQLIGLVQTYELPILLVEGLTRPNYEGLLEIRNSTKGYWYSPKTGQRRFMYRELDHWLMTMQFKAGVYVARTSDIQESAQYVADLYSWWTSKDYDQHRSHLAISTASQLSDRASIIRPSFERRVANELPGIGVGKSAAVSRKFKSVFAMCMADESDWAEIDGVGPKLASGIVRQLRGDK